METEPKILACVDQSRYADFVADYAAWAAIRLALPLEFLHIIDRHEDEPVIRDRSGALGIDTREALLHTLSEADEARSRAAREQGRLFLTRLRERVVAAGVETADIRQRHGELLETLQEQQENVELFVLGRRGESAEITQRDLGRHVESMVRSLDKPILTVSQEFREPRQVLIAFDGSAVTRKGVKMVAEGRLFTGLPIHVLMSGKPRTDAERQLQWARDMLEGGGFEAHVEMIPGDPESVIAQTVLDRDIDMLVMGAYGHSPIRTLLFGSKTADLLRSASIPTLLMR
ncbi:MAG: universal stress protein [Gammaproteobacteria bacterium]|nr:MAG: universal stress protein [Gammaproteobacteria bacterium]